MPAKSVTEFDRNFGLKLREARLLRGLTQEDMAQMVGVSFQQIQKYEYGDNRMTVERLHRLSAGLKMPPSYFFAEDDSAEPVVRAAEASVRLALLIDKLPDEIIRGNFKRLIDSIHKAWEERKAL